jgi:hypothetical protein
MKLLTAGYGAGNGPNMVLRSATRVVPEELESILLSYSCHPPALPKIRRCLEISGRYDAWVQSGWVLNQYWKVRKDLSEIGVDFCLTSVPNIDISTAMSKEVPLTCIEEA